jgi:hypothetical protein
MKLQTGKRGMIILKNLLMQGSAAEYNPQDR